MPEVSLPLIGEDSPLRLGDNAAVDSDVNRIEITCDAGVHTVWTVDITEYAGGESDADSTRHVVSTMLEIEQMIAARMQDCADAVSQVVHTFTGRDLLLRDGSRVEFRWELHVADWRCLDCGINISDIDEYYMLDNEIWQQANPDVSGNLCIGCVENRLGRALTAADFTDKPINTDASYQRSERLTDRLRSYS